MSTPTDLADLAESLVPVASRLVGAVHDDGVAEIGRLLHAMNPCDYPALCVVLAAMVDPDRSAADLLSWVTWDEDSPPTPDSTLFGDIGTSSSSLVEAEFTRPVEQWSEATCKRMRSAWRKRLAGRPVEGGNPVLERRGALEYDRRRKSVSRQRTRLTGPSTGVSSTA